jgi:hypothetical protein
VAVLDADAVIQDASDFEAELDAMTDALSNQDVGIQAAADLEDTFDSFNGADESSEDDEDEDLEDGKDLRITYHIHATPAGV